MNEIGEDIWVIDQPLGLFGVQMGVRMTVVRNPETKDLLCYSPVRPKKELVEEIKKLGQLKAVIAPNYFHYIWASSFTEKFPEAILYHSPSLEKKLEKYEEKITKKTLIDWPADLFPSIELMRMPGVNPLDEFQLYHKPSKTLVVCDLFFNLLRPSSFLEKSIWRMLGVKHGEASQSNLLKVLKWKKRKSYSEYIDEVRAKPISQIVVAHGEVMNRNPNEFLESIR